MDFPDATDRSLSGNPHGRWLGDQLHSQLRRAASHGTRGEHRWVRRGRCRYGVARRSCSRGKAGQCLLVIQSAVTRRTRKLQDALGISLFERQAVVSAPARGNI